MPPLVGYPFTDTFDFTRPVTALVRNAAGAIVAAAIDEPRFDHSEGGSRLGLLVGPGDTLGQADRCAVVAGDWEIAGKATVLHEYADTDDVIRRRAFYTEDARAMVNAVLRVDGHHRIIGAVPGFLKNRSGEVRYRERMWVLAGPIVDSDGNQLEDGSGDGNTPGRGLVEA